MVKSQSISHAFLSMVSFQMIDELLRMFARENFGGDKYYPVFHGETETTKPLALIIKRSRSIWKRPFSKLEMTILAGLEKYVENHNKEAHLEDVKSKIIQEEVLEKEKNAPAAWYGNNEQLKLNCFPVRGRKTFMPLLFSPIQRSNILSTGIREMKTSSDFGYFVICKSNRKIMSHKVGKRK